MSVSTKTTAAVPAALTRAAWRYATGAHMDGIRRTDAGWVRRGTRPLEAKGRVTRWSLLSRAERAGYRLAATGAAGAAGWGELTHPQGTQQTLTGVAAGAAALGTAGAVYGALGWRHRREWIRPLHLALEGPLGLPEGTVPTSYIHVPRDYPSRTDVGRIDLPAAFVGTGGGAATIGEIVRTKLALTDVSVTFKLAGRKPHMVLRQTPRPRARALFADADVRELVLAAPESAPLIGLGPQDRVVSVDLDAESPHILVSASTGGGKSVITRTMTAQMLRQGGQMIVLDFKRHSHKWARGLPNVRYCREIGEIHRALVEMGQEGHSRNIAVDEWEGEGDAPVGPRLAVLVEEANATITKLKRYWQAIRDKDDPKESPAIDALREILFMGRAVKMHVLLVAQSATANALGGPEVRECFATRILSRYTRNAWNMLVPEVQPVPRSTRHVGRAQVVLGGVANETQVAFFTDREAREFAVSGTVSAWQDGSAGMGTAAVTSHGHAGVPVWEDSVYVSRDVTPEAPRLTLVKGGTDAPTSAIPPMPKQPPAVTRYSLAAAARDGIVPMTADALRQAKRRDPEFPAGDDGKWTAEELQRWYANRPAARASEESAG